VLLALVVGCSDDDGGQKVDRSPAVGVDASAPTADASTPNTEAGHDASTPTQGGPTFTGEPLPADAIYPIVFVHGFVGSAQQYESQALRFAMNGYPLERIRAFEHHGTSTDIASFVRGADELIDALMKEYNTSKVYLVGHSRGTQVSSEYLADATRAAKVAKYVALDGRACPMGAVPCLAPNQMNLPGQKHVEVSTSPEAFERTYEFLFGKKPATTAIVAQGPTAKISGRIVNFPENTGRTGTLQLWELVTATGARAGAQPIASFTIGDTGAFGPVQVSTDKFYEFVMSSPEAPNQHHFYLQRFLRDSPFVRLLSGGPDTPSRMNTNASDNHVAISVSRQREWTVDDALEVSTTGASGSQPVVNVMSMPMFRMSIGIHIHDDKATPQLTTLAGLPYFNEQPFQAGVDVYMPAASPPSGTVTIRAIPRGYPDRPQVLNIPNWSSSQHTSAVMFADYPQ
jgi:pimeloyl-ACP methyl ester carboxylesterase